MAEPAEPLRASVGARPGLTVTTITRNEAERLPACLERVTWAEEIVVVDADSTDGTAEVARKFTAKVFVRPWPGFAAQKNFALAQATQPWVLSLDADEQVTPELRAAIKATLEADGPLDGYYVPRQNVFLGQWIRHGTWYPDYQLRLFRRGRGVFRTVAVHEGVELTGRHGYLRSPLLHASYRSVEEFVQRSNTYSTLAAEDLVRGGRPISWATVLLRPLGRFLSMYLLHRGFLDGRAGFILAVLYSHYVFLRCLKAWELQRGEAAPRAKR